MRQSWVTYCLLVFLVLLFSSCKEPSANAPAATSQTSEVAVTPSPTPTPTPPRPSGPIEFADVTTQAGIRFKHNSGAFGKKYLPETIGAGGAFLDYDNDGWQDILLINSMDWPESKNANLFLLFITTTETVALRT